MRLGGCLDSASAEKAARSMKRYLGLRDTDVVYRPERISNEHTLFGIDLGERNYARLREVSV